MAHRQRAGNGAAVGGHFAVGAALLCAVSPLSKPLLVWVWASTTTTPPPQEFLAARGLGLDGEGLTGGSGGSGGGGCSLRVIRQAAVTALADRNGACL